MMYIPNPVAKEYRLTGHEIEYLTYSPDCGYLASYVDDTYQQCALQVGVPYGGQEFDTDDYNIIVGLANCNHSPTEKPRKFPEKCEQMRALA